jgi:predicted phage tail protein
MIQARNVYLHGSLGKEFGECIRLHVSTAVEAVRALALQIPKFSNAIEKGRFHILVGDPKDEFSLNVEEAASFKLGAQDVHIVPVIKGSKSGSGGAVLKIVLGIALIGSALFSAPAMSAIGLGSTWFAGLTYGNVALLGGALALAGISSLVVGKTSSADKAESFILDPQRAAAQGAAIPIVYGTFMDTGVPISSAIDIEQIS